MGQGTCWGEARTGLDAKHADDSCSDSGSEGEPPAGFFERDQVMHRTSVSAEAYGDYNKMVEYDAPAYPKTAEQQRRIETACRKSFMFQALDETMLKKVVAAMQEKEIKQRETAVINQGDEVKDSEAGLFLLESGELKVFKRAKGDAGGTYAGGTGRGAHVHTYTTPGDSFGELALLYNCPRAATVVSAGPCKLWVLERAAFNGLVKNACVKKRTQYEAFLDRVGVLNNLNADAKGKLCDVLKPQTMTVGEAIVKEGEPGDIFFMIESGECEALTAAKGKVMSYKAGDFFGELALKSGSDGIRKATVKCTQAGTLATLDRSVFQRLLGSLADLEAAAKSYK